MKTILKNKNLFHERGILCREKNVDQKIDGEQMRNGDALLTTWTIMVMTAGLKWTEEQKVIEGF